MENKTDKTEKKVNNERKYNIDTMAGVGKKTQIAGREYEILPVNIEDMNCVIGENPDERLIIPLKESLDNGELSYMVFGQNVMGARKQIFLKILNKYVFYKEKPMTEELLLEHNWSFKEIAKFLYFWIEEVSE